MTPIEQINTMRKLVIDGSNTSGFQRTALVAVNGTLPNGGRIETLCLEEEAAQRVEGETFSLDRLGIPLVEITTSPCMHTPEEVREMAGYLGMVLRSTGQVKRGLGTIRQDVNISIKGGARIEVKGVQELDLVTEVVKREAQRQQNLIMIRDQLVSRGASVQPDPVDVTGLFSGTGSSILKKAKMILAVRLNGFSGLVGYEIQPGRRLGTEMSDYAKKCGVGGIFHTDELPAYGITTEEVDALHTTLGTTGQDCIVLVAGTPKQAHCAAMQVIKRARSCNGGGSGRDTKDASRGKYRLHATITGSGKNVSRDGCPSRARRTRPHGTAFPCPNFLLCGHTGSARSSALMKGWPGRSHFPSGSRSLNGQSGKQSIRHLLPALSLEHSRRSKGTVQISR